MVYLINITTAGSKKSLVGPAMFFAVISLNWTLLHLSDLPVLKFGTSIYMLPLYLQQTPRCKCENSVPRRVLKFIACSLMNYALAKFTRQLRSKKLVCIANWAASGAPRRHNRERSAHANRPRLIIELDRKSVFCAASLMELGTARPVCFDAAPRPLICERERKSERFFCALAESNNAPIRAEIIKRANVLCVFARPGVAPLAKSTPRATPHIYPTYAPAADQTALQFSGNERLPIHTKALTI